MPTENRRRFALLRLGLGVAQVMGATALVVFLTKTGTSTLTAMTAVVTLLITILSRYIFARVDRIGENRNSER